MWPRDPHDSGCANLKFLHRLRGLFGENINLDASTKLSPNAPMSIWLGNQAEHSMRPSSHQRTMGPARHNLNGFLCLLNASCTGGFEDLIKMTITYLVFQEVH